MSEVKKPTTVWLNEKQREFVGEVANAAEMTQGEVIRAGVDALNGAVPLGVIRRLNNAPPEIVREIRELRAEVAALRLEVNRIGVNVNQFAREMWTDNADLEEHYAKAVEQVDALQKLLEEAVKEHELHTCR
ncbi:hypothetical protein [Corynebacterium sp. HMSC074E01]|uniref:hypothetical protein n=1 Tax=Corynebacterium sp. HMSC074E01 TaxID=1715017 RepID=UPI0008A5986E|nr:hypothetical protein [Corynebacterium sp. HMSC074E01]OFN75395.1 hypothetical protein HMPREF2537_02790 [Corynebacterium sp. HMSC074E01]